MIIDSSKKLTLETLLQEFQILEKQAPKSDTSSRKAVEASTKRVCDNMFPIIQTLSAKTGSDYKEISELSRSDYKKFSRLSGIVNVIDHRRTSRMHVLRNAPFFNPGKHGVTGTKTNK